MRIAVFGAGAIGSYLGVALHRAGAQVTMIARGSQLAAIQANGLTLVSEGRRFTVPVYTVADAREAGVQDYVFVALKAQAFPGAADAVAALTGPDTAIVTAMNGIPYWYFYGEESPWRDRIVHSVDPGGVLWRTLHPARAIGCVIYSWAQVAAPGVVEQSTSNRFILGEPDGSAGARVKTLAAVMEKGGLNAPIAPRIRDDLWGKLLGNLSMNPLSALTGATVDRLTGEPDLLAIGRAMMVEAAAAAQSLGVRLPMDVDTRLAMTASAGASKTSMLQDLERGRSLEIEAILGAVVELAGLTGHELPLCRTILALVRERAHNPLHFARISRDSLDRPRLP